MIVYNAYEIVRKKNEELTQFHKDIAHSVQVMYEEAFFHLLNKLYEKYKLDNLTWLEQSVLYFYVFVLILDLFYVLVLIVFQDQLKIKFLHEVNHFPIDG